MAIFPKVKCKAALLSAFGQIKCTNRSVCFGSMSAKQDITWRWICLPPAVKWHEHVQIAKKTKVKAKY